MRKKATPTRSSERPTQVIRAVTTVVAKQVEPPVAYLEIQVEGPVTEDSIVHVFERVRDEIDQHQAKKVLVDLRQSSVKLSISDMHGLAKMVTTRFAGIIDKMALVARPQDILPEKFLEPSLINRGLPSLVTADFDEAIYWLGAKFKQPR